MQMLQVCLTRGVDCCMLFVQMLWVLLMCAVALLCVMLHVLLQTKIISILGSNVLNRFK